VRVGRRRVDQGPASPPDAEEKQESAIRPSPSRRLLMEVIVRAIEEAGETFRPFGDGPLIRAVTHDIVRDRYYARIAEKAHPDDDPQRLAESRRKSFNRAIKAELDAKRLLRSDEKREAIRMAAMRAGGQNRPSGRDGTSLKGVCPGVPVPPGYGHRDKSGHLSRCPAVSRYSLRTTSDESVRRNNARKPL
jgi:hypothetical protein